MLSPSPLPVRAGTTLLYHVRCLRDAPLPSFSSGDGNGGIAPSNGLVEMTVPLFNVLSWSGSRSELLGFLLRAVLVDCLEPGKIRRMRGRRLGRQAQKIPMLHSTLIQTEVSVSVPVHEVSQ